MTKILFNLLMLCMILSSCSNKAKTAMEKKDLLNSPETLYNLAIDAIEESKFHAASKKFAQLSKEYPYSKWSNKAKIMEAYSLFKTKSYDEAIALIDYFIMLHPANEYIEYAHYLKALCYYYQISDVYREQEITILADSAFKEVIKKFPNGKYVKDSKLKLDLINDHLAGKEMEIGRFYLKRGKLISAINRFKEVTKKYQTTIHIQEALYRIAAIYVDMNLTDEAQKYAAVLGKNYPESKWYKYSYNLFKAEAKNAK